jgi:hypothetical protein
MRPFAASAAVAVVAVDHPEHGVDPLYKTLLGAAVLCLIVLAVGFGFSYRRLSAGRAEAVEARGKEIEARRSAEEARNKLAAQLKEADIARARIESDLDRSEGALAQVRAEFELVRAELQGAKEQSVAMHSAGEQANAITVIEERKPEAQPAKPAPEPKEAIKAEATPKAEQQLRDEKPVEPFSTPLPDLELATEEPGEAATPEEPAPTAPQESAPATPAPKPAGIDRPDFAKAMPDLIASVIAVEGAESQAAIRITDATPPAVKAMGLRDGDIITRINRNPIVTVDDAKQALVNVQKDTGFSIRVTRNGRTGWMRVNFTRPPEPPAVQPPQPEPAPAEPTPPPPAEPEPPADEAQPAPPEPEPENQ